MRRVRAAAVLSGLALVAGLATATPSASADETAPATPSVAAEPAPAEAPAEAAPAAPVASAPAAAQRRRAGGKAPDKFTPRNGAKFNNPVGSAAKKRVLLRQLIRTINSVPRGEQIRVASWNIRSRDVANALIAAHYRGVSVQAAMDNLNANPRNPNVGVNRMIAAFNKNKKKRPKERRSAVTKCLSSCRYTSGIAHTKFYLFSKAGKASDVVMFGSNNATDLAAYYQWNDLYTVVDNPTLYAEFEAVFQEMRKDKPVKQPYLSYAHPENALTTYFYPYRGDGTATDPLTDQLDQVQCSGAAPGFGTNGATKIRIAQTSMHSERGLAVAAKLRQLWEQGCDVKIVYAVFGNNVLKVLRNTSRGPVPIKQIAQDFDLDGVYDRYLHLKDLAISGNFGGNPGANVVFNGSANYTSVALASDEIVARIDNTNLTRKYSKWVDTLFKNPPRYRGRMATLATMARMSALAGGVSPESGIEEN